MRHAAPGELLELFFGELAGSRREACDAHLRACAACRALLTDVEWAEGLLREGTDDTPPADGFRRVLDRIEAVRPARERRKGWLALALPSAAALVGGSVAVHEGGLTAALALFALGSIVTLSLAPVLILEAQRRS